MEKLTKYADLVLNETKRLGADSAQCVMQESQTTEFNVDGGEFSLMRTLFDRYLSLSVLKEGRLGSLTVNRVDEASLLSAAADAISSSESAVPDEAREFAPGPAEESFTLGSPEADADRLFERVRELMDDVKQRHPKIIMEQLIAFHIRTKKVYKNTNGVIWRTLSGQYELEIIYSAHDGDDSTSMYGASIALTDLEKPFIEISNIDREMSEVEAQLGAAPLAGKFTGTAVFAPGCLAGDVFWQIMQNFASDAPLIDGTSPWKDKLGQSVADPRIDLMLAPSDRRIVCGQKYTGEGYPAEDFHVLRDGVLERFCLSQYGANKTGHPRGGNTSLSMVVRPGDTPLDDMLAGIERGIYLMRFSGGHPSASGEFSGVAKNAFLIENGRLTRPLTETMVSGNLADMLLHLRGVSRETVCDGSMVMPYMAFDGITVSGK